MFQKKGIINLYWYRMSSGYSNYGDELSPYIIHELTGKKIRYIPYPYKWYKVPYKYLQALIKKSALADFKGIFRSIFAKNILFAIGSTIHKYDRKGIVVWGSGIMYANWKIDHANFKAVRGYETKRKLEKLGFNSPTVIGDPALLLPLFIVPNSKKYEIGIIPHFIHYKELLNNNIIPHEYLIVDMKENIHNITKQIISCEYVISSSLHGLIVAHAYKIPALWVDFNCKNKLAGDNVKFKDYFSSVEIDYYDPIILESFDHIYIKNLINKYSNKTLINNDLKKLQKDLLKAAPFELKGKYQKMI